jgi:ribosome assembly protein RRB1
MGKKSKRNNRPKPEEHARIAPAMRKPPPPAARETVETLDFQDPYVDDCRVQGEGGDDEEGDWEDEDEEQETGEYEVVQSWNPLTGEGAVGEKLEMDPSAYKMYHAMTAEWPSLSFDILRDDLGDARTRFPHCLTAALGSQADRPENNQLTILKLSDLSKIDVETEDDILGEELNKGGKDDDDDSSDEEIDLDPVAEHYAIPHYGGVNRVRCMPQKPSIVATWSDVGKVNLFDVSAILQRFSVAEGKASATKDIPKKAFFSYGKHSAEGWAMDWSNVNEGQLATGDCAGNIHIWSPQGKTEYSVSPSYPADKTSSLKRSSLSIEDLQWSPTEATVFGSAECGGVVRIFDTRAPGRPMISHQIHDNVDVNVLSWNPLVSNLLATGSDDGVLSVWDLRKFNTTTDALEPLARFTPHKSSLNSVEWHPTDESMLAVTDDAGAYIYDLSVEEDATSKTAIPDLPPQLLFVHSGSEQFKEVHWHPQISSCLMTTALSGYSVFIPSNL